MILQAGSHLINMDRVTHIGPGTGGNKSTFHFEGGGIAVTGLTFTEIAELLGPDHVSPHIDSIRPEPEPEPETQPEGVIDDSEGFPEDEV